jgi:hypothetical protein
MDKLAREVTDIFGHGHSDRADFEPVLPAGDVDQADFDAIKGRFVADYLQCYDRVVHHWTARGQANIQAATEQLVHSFEESTRSRTQLMQETDALRQAADRQIAQERQARVAA